MRIQAKTSFWEETDAEHYKEQIERFSFAYTLLGVLFVGIGTIFNNPIINYVYLGFVILLGVLIRYSYIKYKSKKEQTK